MSDAKTALSQEFTGTVGNAIKRLGVNEVAEMLRLEPEIVRKYATGSAEPVDHLQREIIDTLSPFI